VPDLVVVADHVEAAMNADEELPTLFLAVLGPGIAPRGKALTDGIDERGDHEPVDVPGVGLADAQRVAQQLTHPIAGREAHQVGPDLKHLGIRPHRNVPSVAPGRVPADGDDPAVRNPDDARHEATFHG
jgi:hypothetical protein